MAARLWSIVGGCLLAGGVGGFVAGRFVRPHDSLTVPHPSTDEMQAVLTSRAIDGDVNGSISVRAEIVDRCAKASGMLGCMRDNYHLLVIDAENGSLGGMVATAIALSDSRDCRDLRRAVFWLNKAHRLGKDVSATSKLLVRASNLARCPVGWELSS